MRREDRAGARAEPDAETVACCLARQVDGVAVLEELARLARTAQGDWPRPFPGEFEKRPQAFVCVECQRGLGQRGYILAVSRTEWRGFRSARGRAGQVTYWPFKVKHWRDNDRIRQG